MEIARWLESKRQRMGRTNTEFAALIGVSYATWLAAKTDDPVVGDAIRIGALRAFRGDPEWEEVLNLALADRSPVTVATP